jgi:6-phosphogluconolactonase (cycloisomerase 2 family)
MNTIKFLTLALAASVSAISAAQIYTQTNEAGQNRIAEIRTNFDGSLAKPQFFATGGAGTGAGLGVQYALNLSRDGRYLYVVNAGSNDISTFALGDAGPRFIGKTPSGGVRPVSVAVRGDVVYVVNAGGEGNISGFRISPNGTLQPIPNSSRPLSAAGAAPGQISFNPEGDTLYVTEKNMNRITYYQVDGAGMASPPSWVPSAGTTPFGFDFGRRGKLIVSEAFGGAPGGSAVSSYLTDDDGTAFTVAASYPTHQTAACWVTVTRDGKFAYAGNAGGSDTITGYRVYSDGTLDLLARDGVSARVPKGFAVTDLNTDQNGHLFSLAPGKGGVFKFAVQPNGRLVPQSNVYGLPKTVTGLVVR